MNILILSQFFSTTKGGGEYVFSLMAKSLADSGHNIWVITNQIRGEVYPSHKNIKIIFIPPIIEYQGGIPPGFYDNFAYTFHSIRKGLAIIKKNNIDIIHSNNFAPALAGSILSYFSGKKHVITIHDVFSLCGKNYWKEWGRQSNISKINVLLAPIFEKMILKLKHDSIHTVSKATENDLVKFGAKGSIHVIPNSIEIFDILPVEEISHQFVYIGRLVFYKNLEIVIRAIKVLEGKYPKIKLVIAGGGPHRQNLESMVNNLNLHNNVEFRGYVTQEEKLRLLSESKALVFPSLCEGFGLVILEAFAQRKPVLVSDIPPLSDIVSNEITGLVIESHDEHEWARGLLEIIEFPDRTKKMGYTGREVLEKKYNIENMKKLVLEMYDNVLHAN